MCFSHREGMRLRGAPSPFSYLRTGLAFHSEGTSVVYQSESKPLADTRSSDGVTVGFLTPRNVTLRFW